MQQLVNAHEKQKKIYSISKEGNKLAYIFDLKQKETDKKGKTIEVGKLKKEEKPPELSHLKILMSRYQHGYH